MKTRHVQTNQEPNTSTQDTRASRNTHDETGPTNSPSQVREFESTVIAAVNPNSKIENPTSANRLPVTFRVSRFKPCLHRSLPVPIDPPSAILHPPSLQHSIPPPFSLHRGLGFWQLTFNGQSAVFKHEQGAAYVACLLLHPPAQPIHGLDLATRIAAAEGNSFGLTEITDPLTGQKTALSADARIQERSPELDRAHLMRRVLRQQEALEAILEDEAQTEPVKAEAQRELVSLYQYERENSKRVRDSAQKAAHAVGMAIKRFYRRMASARSADGSPAPVLRAFAAHIHDFILLPSGRYIGSGRSRAQLGIAGCFTYQPPPGLTWSA